MANLIDIKKIKPMDFPSTEMDGLDVVQYLNTLPAVDAVEVVHGRWKGAGMGDYFCSLCSEVVSGNEHNFCPNCGAKMDGVFDV